MNSENDEIRMTNVEGMTRMTNAEEALHLHFVILASSLIRHSTFVLRHFTSRCSFVVNEK